MGFGVLISCMLLVISTFGKEKNGVMENVKFDTIRQFSAMLNNSKDLLDYLLKYRYGDGLRFEEALLLLNDRVNVFDDLVDHRVIVEENSLYVMGERYTEVFCDILNCNEELRVGTVADYIDRLTKAIKYCLKETVARERKKYLTSIRRELGRIVEVSQYNVIALHHQVESTYKNETSMEMKKEKLQDLMQSRSACVKLIESCTTILNDNKFQLCAIDSTLILLINESKTALQQAIAMLMAEDQNFSQFVREYQAYDQRRDKLRKLIEAINSKVVEQKTNITQLANERNEAWMCKRPRYSYLISLDGMENSNLATEIAMHLKYEPELKQKREKQTGPPLTREELEQAVEIDEQEDLDHIRREFLKGKADLYTFLLHYEGYVKPHTREEIFSLFCLMTSLYDLIHPDAETYKQDGDIEYLEIKPNKQKQR